MQTQRAPSHQAPEAHRPKPTARRCMRWSPTPGSGPVQVGCVVVLHMNVMSMIDAPHTCSATLHPLCLHVVSRHPQVHGGGNGVACTEHPVSADGISQLGLSRPCPIPDTHLGRRSMRSLGPCLRRLIMRRRGHKFLGSLWAESRKSAVGPI